jgi:hypothetical protein
MNAPQAAVQGMRDDENEVRLLHLNKTNKSGSDPSGTALRTIPAQFKFPDLLPGFVNQRLG